jgi:hypothetical protein
MQEPHEKGVANHLDAESCWACVATRRTEDRRRGRGQTYTIHIPGDA